MKRAHKLFLVELLAAFLIAAIWIIAEKFP